MNNMTSKEETPVGSIYYDGLCLLCSREIEHYRKQKGSDRFQFIDITSPGFDAGLYGLDPFKVHRVMHVRDTSGNLKTGVEAFRAIWKELPRYQFLYRLTDNKIAGALMQIGYSGFAQIRPYLPRKKANCETSPYCDLKEHS
jgi:predicted DCC family thiol-disulfide oxidoreductase YuxK